MVKKILRIVPHDVGSMLGFWKEASQHADTLPIALALSIGGAVGVYTGYHFLTSDPDVLISHKVSKNGASTIDFADKMKSEGEQFNSSIFRRIANLRHVDVNLTGGGGWDTSILPRK